jgi:hypothetical protein
MNMIASIGKRAFERECRAFGFNLKPVARLVDGLFLKFRKNFIRATPPPSPNCIVGILNEMESSSNGITCTF